VYALRLATPDDFDAVFSRTKQFNALEHIAIDDAKLAAGLRRLLAETALGGAWLVLRAEPRRVPDGAWSGEVERTRGEAMATTIVGHAVVTLGYDLEFGGHDAFLTEIWIDEPARNAGAGAAALALIERELRARDVCALHLMVRPEHPALQLYERAGFVRSPRVAMTKLL
jgi:GNAT superfamily N-acetyltransferase